MTLVGVSTAVLAPTVERVALLALRPDVVEWYALPPSFVTEIERLAEHGIQSALHAPMPYEGPRPPLARATSADPELVEAALAMTRQTLDCARRLGALYVVLHFPDPFPPYVEAGFRDRANRFLDEVANLAARAGVPVLLENLTPNPFLHSADHYASVLARHPTLGLCLDLGHAHLLERARAVEEYVEALGPRIGAVHVYNTTRARYDEHGHEPIDERQTEHDGYLDWREAVAHVLEVSEDAALIVEHEGRFGLPAAREALALLRGLAGRAQARVRAEAT